MAHLVFINRVYPPEAGATGQLLAELAEHLAARGHRVEVVTASRAESAGVGAEATWRGVTVRRYWSPGLRGRSLGAKAINYLAQYPCLGWQLCRLPTCDVVVSVTDPPLQLVLAALFRRKARGGLIHWAQDVYPEVAEELGVLRRGGWVAQRLRRLAHWAIHRHRALVAVGRCMEERLAQRPGGLEGLVRRVIPNWAPLPEARADEAAAVQAFRRTLTGGREAFVVMYSGNFGRAHPFEAVVEAVRELETRAPQVHFALVGEGPRLAWVKEAVKGRANVSFHPYQPWAQLRVSLAAADVHLACMETHLQGLVVPSKVYGALGVGRPCVFLGPEGSEVARLLQESGSGVVLARPTGAELAEVLFRLATDRAAYAAQQQRAAAVAPQVAKAARLEEWAELIEFLVREEAEAVGAGATVSSR